MTVDPIDSEASDYRQQCNSAELLERAHRLIPEAAQTNAKNPSSWVRGVSPTHLVRGEGCHVWDVDGNEYIDHVSALGPIVLGHNYPAVTQAVKEQISEGTMFSLPHPLQIDVAEQIVEMVPCAEAVRFAKNGNDVTSLAVKLARAFTGRDIVAYYGYHGWADVWLGGSNRDRGIPDGIGDRTVPFRYGDIETLERIFTAYADNVAAVVMPPANATTADGDFLQEVRELTREEDALLVFDEIVTGFRYGIGGAQKYFDVTPDLACFAKAIANGYPLSAIAGRRDVMDVLEADDFYFSLTYAGETVSLAAANASLSVLREESVSDHIFEQGEKLRDGYNDLAATHELDDYTECQGLPPYSRAKFRDPSDNSGTLLQSLFVQECVKRGVLFSGTHLPTYSHTDEDVERTLEVYDAAMAEVVSALRDDAVEERLEGAPIGASLPNASSGS